MFHDEFEFDINRFMTGIGHSRKFKSGGGGGTKSASTLSPEQREALKAVNDFILPLIGTGATAIDMAKFVVQAPDAITDWFGKFQESQGQQPTGAINQALDKQISGEPSFVYDPQRTANQWQKSFAAPMMTAWNDIVKPIVKEGFNVPGGPWDRRMGEGISRSANEFFNTSIAPTFMNAQLQGNQMGFQAGETAAGRVLPAANMRFNMPNIGFQNQAMATQNYMNILQQPKSMALQNQMRMLRENDPWTQMAMGYMVQPTMQTISKAPGTDWGATGLQAAGMGLGAYGALAESDIRVKENIEALTKVSKLKAYSYNYKGTPKKNRRVGLMAQDVEKVLPEAVIEIKGIKHVDYNSVVALLVDAVNELRMEVYNGSSSSV